MPPTPFDAPVTLPVFVLFEIVANACPIIPPTLLPANIYSPPEFPAPVAVILPKLVALLIPPACDLPMMPPTLYKPLIVPSLRKITPDIVLSAKPKIPPTSLAVPVTEP